MAMKAQNVEAMRSLVDIPPEIFAVLEAYLEISEIASVILTCKSIKQSIEQFLYKKVYISPASPNTNTRSFVTLLNHRPEIADWVHKFVINEYDVEYTPKLLSHTFSNLENIILQHSGPLEPSTLSQSELDTLNAAINPQPLLENLTVNVEQHPNASVKDTVILPLPASACTLFRHPRLTRMRLSYLNFTAFDFLPDDYFNHSALSELCLERCTYSAKNLHQFVHPCKSLAKLWLYQDQRQPFPADELPAILQPAKATLRALKMVWGHLKPLTSSGMDFRSFSNLHAIMAHPELIFGKAYISPQSSASLSHLIQSHLPPHLIILALEGVVPIAASADEEGGPAPGPMPEQFVQSGDRPIPAHDLSLMRHVLNHKDSIVPGLEWLVVYYLEHMQSVPKDVITLSKKKQVRCCGLYENDEIAPPIEMELYERGRKWEGGGSTRGFCSHLDHTG